MRGIGRQVVAGLFLILGGCQLFTTASQNLVFEITENADRSLVNVRDRRAGELAWGREPEASVGGKFSEDVEDGFVTGYACYLEAGDADVPPIPPRKYWKRDYQTPEGHAAIEGWYQGFRRGLAAAQGSGRRPLIPVPGPSSAAHEAPSGLLILPPRVSPVPETEPVLPLPRKVPTSPRENDKQALPPPISSSQLMRLPGEDRTEGVVNWTAETSTGHRAGPG